MLEIADIVAQAGAPESEFTRFASVTSDLIRFVDLFRSGDTQPRFRLRDYQLEFGPGGATAPDVVLRRDSSTGLLHSIGSLQVGFANNSTESQRNSGLQFDAAAQHGIEPHYNGSLWGTALFTRTGGEIRFGRYAASAAAQNTLEMLGRFGGSGGFVVGAPTGGDKGAGGINATGVWVNNQPVWHAGNFDPATSLATRMNLATWNDGNAVPGWQGFQPYWSTGGGGGGVNYPEGSAGNQAGAGFLVSRFADSTSSKTGSFHIWSFGSASTTRLWFRKQLAADAWSSWFRIWHAGDQGAGSGMDADTVDGLQASAFSLVGHTHPYLPLAGGTVSGAVTLSTGLDLKAQNPGEIATHFAVWASSPYSTALTVGARTVAEVLSDIGALPVAGGTITGTLGFGTATRQMVNLYDTAYAIGVQSSTWYARTAARFSFFLGGVHSGTQNDPGTGGTVLFTFNNSEILYKGQAVYHAGNPPPGSGGPSVLAWKHVTVNATTGAITGTVSSGGSEIVIEAHSDAHEFIVRVPASLGSYSVRITVRPPVGSIDDAAHGPAFERIADATVGGVNHHTYHVWSSGNPYDALQATPVDRLCIEVIQ
jgi:hypothetical protein